MSALQLSSGRQLFIATVSAAVAAGAMACHPSPTIPTPAQQPSLPPAAPVAPGPLLRGAELCVGRAEFPNGCSAPNADGGYTLDASREYTIWFDFSPRENWWVPRCVAFELSYSWNEPGTSGETCPSGVCCSSWGSYFTTPAADARLDLQNQRIRFFVQETGPDLSEPRTETIEIPIRIMPQVGSVPDGKSSLIVARNSSVINLGIK